MQNLDFEYIKTFFKNNPLTLCCSFIYLLVSAIILGGKPINWLFCIVLYAVSLGVVFSPVGETILKIVENIRPLCTKREKEYLMPIFEEAYAEAKEHNPELKLELCVIDQMYVNACSLGRHTIAVTKGAMETFSEDELKAIISHEIGHIANKDTITSLYLLVGEGFFSIVILFVKLFVNLLEIVTYSLTRNGFLRFIASFLRFLFQIALYVFTFLINFITAISNRGSEFRADAYAHKLGYGQEMTDALYLLEKINLSDKSTIITKLLANHPIIPLRIMQLERLLEK